MSGLTQQQILQQQMQRQRLPVQGPFASLPGGGTAGIGGLGLDNSQSFISKPGSSGQQAAPGNFYSSAVQSIASRPNIEGGLPFDPNAFPGLPGSSSRLHPTVSLPTPPVSRDDDFTIMNEDFPALPGSQPVKNDSNFPQQQQQQQQQQMSDRLRELGEPRQPLSSSGGSSSNLSTAGNVSMPFSPALTSSPLRQSFPSASAAPASTSILENGHGAGGVGAAAQNPGGGTSTLSNDAKYGMAGLLDVIRLTDRDLATLALGSDLTTFGLNLNSTDCLFATFLSPFLEQPTTAEPAFTTPSCYLIQPPPLKAEFLMKFQLETLFYVFYSMPRDVMQAFAAQELYRRDWRYHRELRYFDVNSWEPKLLTVQVRGNVAAGFLSEEEIRVKAPSS